ncbi:MAG: class I SAM-dependent methyltransferase [Brevibacterium aurantiacum]|uniref:16S rRNA (Guanine1207-N2)-methyltransferase n=1 Tax=Brevibacterium aurantiacum TaxID=273384 RepID=A0A2A3ZTQ9_BREAU|nr:methyltransferase [Brevibacterium aurantiacum]PCC54881.1 16S rRNA methyltransferase [Brevibacterium aurantiacum]PCC57085.1 16S rRNA methyltransferase [Brevibacterium aurantiacum]SMX73992.1 16S rRNA (guanine1207-N2)-methyltransferase [Brevibacterium aurantiacum]
MPSTLLSPDFSARHRSQELLEQFPELAAVPGFPQARILTEYVLGRRSGELDVSGRATEGTFVDAEAVAGLPHEVLIVDDGQGLQSRLLSEIVPVRTYNDRVDEVRTVAEVADQASAIDDLAVFAPEAQEVWAIVNAPKATQALAETIAAVQAHVTTIVVIGRSDSMSRAVNKELARGFARVDVSPGVGKHRMIIGSRPLSSPSLPSFPRHSRIDHPATGPLQVRAHGACFSGVKSDEGSAALLTALAADTQAAETRTAGVQTAEAGPGSPNSVLDLGCGNGWLLAAAMQVTAADKGAGVDVSKAAVASTRETAEANGLDVETILADATDVQALTGADSSVRTGGQDLILLNPPFHQGTTIETDTAAGLMRTAAELLAPEGRIFTVYNSHLHYRETLERVIGPSEQVARSSKFTVVRSLRRG